MKPNWVAVVCGVVLVAASFSIAFIEGATAAREDAARLAPTIAQTR
ncbi:MAG: hypothetical protein ACX939_14895 [Hyphococcus sp.]